MSKVIATGLLLVCGAAWADGPADAPLADVPGTSVHLLATQAAPFTGYLVSDAETERRGKKDAKCAGTAADAQANGVLLPKVAAGTVIGVAAAAVITSIALGIAYAAKK